MTSIITYLMTPFRCYRLGSRLPLLTIRFPSPLISLFISLSRFIYFLSLYVSICLSKIGNKLVEQRDNHNFSDLGLSEIFARIKFDSKIDEYTLSGNPRGHPFITNLFAIPIDFVLRVPCPYHSTE